MGGFLQQLAEQVKKTWENLSSGQKITFLVTPTVLLIVLVVVTLMATKPAMEVLFGELSPDQASRISAHLDELNVPYSISNGNIIKVPADQRYKLRMDLASEGVLMGNGKGLELFETPRLGMTDRLIDINYVRALSVELQRTIEASSLVDSSRVNLVIPGEKWFKEDEHPPTAAVFLRTRGDLDRDAVRGIADLVAASVEGMKPENVKIMDQHFRVLSDFLADSGTPMGLSQHQQELVKACEERLEKKALDMVEPVVGMGNARVKVSAQLDFSQLERTTQKFDPNTVVRSEQRDTESSTNHGAGGVPGVESNVPDAKAAAATAAQAQPANEKETSKVVTNNEVSSTVEKLVQAPGTINKLSVSVLVNGSYEPDGEKKKYVPRPDDQLQLIAAMVRKAVGFNETRDGAEGFTIANLPFEQAQLEVAETEVVRQKWVDIAQKLLSPTVVGMVAITIVAFFFLRRALRGGVLVPMEEAEEQELLPKSPPAPRELSAEELGIYDVSAVGALSKEEQHRLKLQERVTEFAHQKPEEVATIVKTWLAE